MVSIGGIGDVTYDIFNVYEDISNAKCNCLGHHRWSNNIKRYHIEGFEPHGLSTRARLNNIKLTCDL